MEGLSGMRAFMFALAFVATPAFAADETDREADREAVRSAITRQIEAFRANDSAAAYAQAAPQIRNLFPSPETFIAMVERGYPAVLRPRTYRFDDARDTADDEIAQGVTLQDENGLDWVAVYALQKQGDGTWRITGCHLRRAPGNNA